MTLNCLGRAAPVSRGQNNICVIFVTLQGEGGVTGGQKSNIRDYCQLPATTRLPPTCQSVIDSFTLFIYCPFHTFIHWYKEWNGNFWRIWLLILPVSFWVQWHFEAAAGGIFSQHHSPSKVHNATDKKSIYCGKDVLGRQFYICIKPISNSCKDAVMGGAIQED